MESAPPAERKEKLRRRSSILKMAPTSPDEEDAEELTSRRCSRRVSFATRFHVQEFSSDEVTVTRWAEAYEKEAQVTDSSGEASAAALASATRSALLDTTQHLNATMELTDVEKSFSLAPLASFPVTAGRGGALDATLGSMPNFLREDSDPDKENMIPSQSAGSVAGAGVNPRLAAVVEPRWPTPGDRLVSASRPCPGGGLLELLGGSEVATPPFLRQPAPGGVLDMLRRAGVVSQSPPSRPSSTAPGTFESGHSALDLLGGVKVDTPPFLRYLDTVKDDVQKPVDMDITTAADPQKLVMATSGTTMETSQMELTGLVTRQTVENPSGQTSLGQGVPGVSGVVHGVDEELDRGIPRIDKPRALGNGSEVSSADMELTSALPRGLPSLHMTGLNKSTMNGRDMELTVADPRANANAWSGLNQTIAESGDMEMTAPVCQTIQKQKSPEKMTDEQVDVVKLPSQLSKTLVSEADMELTGAIPQPAVHPKTCVVGTAVDVSEMIETTSTLQVSKITADETDMEFTAAVPHPVPEPFVAGRNMEVKPAALPEEAAKPFGQINKTSPSITHEEMADEQVIVERSTQLSKTLVEADMELTGAIPQLSVITTRWVKTALAASDTNESLKASRTTADETDMEFTAAVPQPMPDPFVYGRNMEVKPATLPNDAAKPFGQINRAIPNIMLEEVAGEQVDVMKPSQLSKTLVDEADMELTGAIPQPAVRPLSLLARTTVDVSEANESASTQQASITTADEIGMELTAAVPQPISEPFIARRNVEVKPATLPKDAAKPFDQMNKATTSITHEVTGEQVSVKRASQPSNTLVDEADMELTGAIPRPAVHSLSHLVRTTVDVSLANESATTQQEGKAIAGETGMEFTGAVPQPIAEPFVDGRNMKPKPASFPKDAAKPFGQINRAIPNIMLDEVAGEQLDVMKPSSQLSKTVVDEADMELTAAIPRPAVHSPHLVRTTVDVSEASESASTQQPSKTTADKAGMEFTAGVPQPVTEPFDDERNIEVKAATVPKDAAKPFGRTNRAIKNIMLEEVAGEQVDVMKPSHLSKTLVDEADMELTGVIPQPAVRPLPFLVRTTDDVPEESESASTQQASKTAADVTGMEFTAAVPQPISEHFVAGRNVEVKPATIPKDAAKSFDQMNKATMSITHGKVTGEQVIVKHSSQSGKTVVDEVDMELTGAIPQPAVHPNTSAVGTTVDVSEMVETTSTLQVSKITADETGMEFTAAVPQPVTEPFVAGRNMEVKPAAPRKDAAKPFDQISKATPSITHEKMTGEQVCVKRFSQLSKTLVEADMELTGAISQPAVLSPSHLLRTTVEVSDTSQSASIPQEMIGNTLNLDEMNKTVGDECNFRTTAAITHSGVPMSNTEKDGSIVDETSKEVAASARLFSAGLQRQMSGNELDSDIKMSSVFPQSASKPPCQTSESESDASNVVVGAASVQSAMVWSHKSKSIHDEASMEMTEAVPQAVVLDPLSRAGEATMNAPDKVVAFPQDIGVQDPSSQPNKTAIDRAEAELAAGTVPRKAAKSSKQIDKTIVDVADMDETVAVLQSVKLSNVQNHTVVDGTDMEMTSAFAERVIQRSGGELNKITMNDSPTPSSPKRLLEEPDNSSRRSPKSPRLEGFASEVAESDEASRIENSRDKTDYVSSTSEDGLSVSCQALSSVTSPHLEENNRIYSDGDLSSQRADKMHSESAHQEKRTAVTQLECTPSSLLNGHAGSTLQEQSIPSSHDEQSPVGPFPERSSGPSERPSDPVPDASNVSVQHEEPPKRQSDVLQQMMLPADLEHAERPISAQPQDILSKSVQEVRPASPKPAVVQACQDQELSLASSLEEVRPTSAEQEVRPVSPVKYIRLGSTGQAMWPSPAEEVRPASLDGKMRPASLEKEVNLTSPVIEANRTNPKRVMPPNLPEVDQVNSNLESHLSSPGQTTVLPAFTDISVSEMLVNTSAQSVERLDAEEALSIPVEEVIPEIPNKIVDSASPEEVVRSNTVAEVLPASRKQEVLLERPEQKMQQSIESSGSPEQELRPIPVREVLPVSPDREMCPENPEQEMWSSPVEDIPLVSPKQVVRLASSDRKMRPASPEQEVWPSPLEKVPLASPKQAVRSASSEKGVQPATLAGPKQESRPSLLEVGQESSHLECRLSSPGQTAVSPSLADASVSEMLLGTPARVDAHLNDLFDESFPNISVFNDSFCGVGQRPALSSSLEHSSHLIAERRQSCKTDSPPLPNQSAVEEQSQRRSSPPMKELPGWRCSHGVPEQGLTKTKRTVLEEARGCKRSQMPRESSRCRDQPVSPQRKRFQSLDLASDRPVASRRVRCDETAEEQNLPSSLRLPPPLRLPDCRALVRGLKAHLEAYRRARETSERETREVVEAALARRKLAQ